MNNLIYQGDTLSRYAASTASTWIWAPALFVSSSVAYYYGLAGLAIFLIPNILCLILFGIISSYIINNKMANVSFLQLIDRCSTRQKNLHFLIGFIVTICSTIVQFLGMNIIVNTWFDVDPVWGAITISLIALAIVWNGGIKNSIISDYYKWIVIALAGLAILCNTGYNIDFEPSSLKIFNPDDLTYLIGFGVTTSIGLLTSPYVDQTMWQRAFSVDNKHVIKMFIIAAIMFAAVPLSFGLTAMMFAASGDVVSGWEIAKAIGVGPMGIILSIAIFFTLLSTIDSNLCAIENYIRTEFNSDGHLAMVAVLLFATIVVSTIDITVTQLFLIYGSIRTVGAVPTLLIGFDHFNERRLFWGTIGGLVIGSCGYVILSLLGNPFAFVCTILALTIPLVGYQRKYP